MAKLLKIELNFSEESEANDFAAEHCGLELSYAVKCDVKGVTLAVTGYDQGALVRLMQLLLDDYETDYSECVELA